MNSLIGIGEVFVINLALSGDNAVVIGLAAAGLPGQQRRKAILFGILAATLLRLCFALIASQMLDVFGLLFVGGVLLAWVSWKMWSELRQDNKAHCLNNEGHPDNVPSKTLFQAVTQIVIADVSMSLDNVLAVAGAAGQSTTVLVAGLLMSIALMGVAATFIADVLNRWRWLGYAGVALIAYVAVTMIWQGSEQMLSSGILGNSL
ncbi:MULTISPECIES: TerC family protein [unclassified Mesorhizobium]|uniref:TerC family protein n=1 Tax=unclassified Mesorhizobium TaxID=325217 RepID=UPI001129949B|nr:MULTISPECIES: TerC family protein [unclassified Mesorhizobium]MBZ9894375.1 TerC family protein [Mesorhizobium sp. BR1-1-6]TPM57666.1 TerC family protein [Mesorhizobium sp. B2-2-4]TPM65531.1 TerC family protein [Mesorhizobium sp. B2-2-1]TPM98506.1 TerC family protein [Mesorhizobium sp. B2-1-5]TPN38559.1 TerC family protein [Mesorhizobium sp. B1-1-6]